MTELESRLEQEPLSVSFTPPEYWQQRDYGILGNAFFAMRSYRTIALAASVGIALGTLWVMAQQTPEELPMPPRYEAPVEYR